MPRASNGYFSSHSTTPLRGFTAFDTTLIAGRRCEILEDSIVRWPPDTPFFTARVRWISSDEPHADAEELARSIPALVDEWLELVRTTKRERITGQMNGVLGDLGPITGMSSTDGAPAIIGFPSDSLPFSVPYRTHRHEIHLSVLIQNRALRPSRPNTSSSVWMSLLTATSVAQSCPSG